jgi:predicted flavoprotein YhiN
MLLFKSTEKVLLKKSLSQLGIDLKEINFKTMESKLHENLYFAGEIVILMLLPADLIPKKWTSGYILQCYLKQYLLLTRFYTFSKFS